MKLHVDRRLLGVLCAALCLTVGACGKTNKNVNKANLDKIKPGMTRAEVEEILGPGEDDPELSLPEGSSVAGASGIGGDLQSLSKPRNSTKWLKWGSDKKFIKVGFDNGKVSQGKIQSQGF